MGSRLFLDRDFQSRVYLKDVRFFLEVHFESIPGSYAGCNSSEQIVERRSIEVYPGMDALTSFEVRKAPSIVVHGCTNENLCCIILYDVGRFKLHNIWLNWPLDTNLLDYKPLIHSTASPNPFIFLAFRQAGEIRFLDSRGFGYESFEFSIPEFVRQYHLQGPISLTCVPVVSDLFAIGYYEALGTMQNCPSLLERAIRHENETVSPDLKWKIENVNLLMWMTVKYSAPEIDFKVCCKKFFRRYRGRKFWVDPIRNALVAPEETIDKPEVFVQARSAKDQRNSAGTYQDKLFTLMFVQPESDYHLKEEDMETVFVHWFIYNSHSDNILKGTEFVPYMGVLPTPDRMNPRYYFLLFEQEKQLGRIDPWFSVNCGPLMFRTRCRFQLNRFVEKNELRLVGLNRFRISDPSKQYYLKYLWSENQLVEQKTSCDGERTFSEPCGNGAKRLHKVHYVILLLLQNQLSFIICNYMIVLCLIWNIVWEYFSIHQCK